VPLRDVMVPGAPMQIGQDGVPQVGFRQPGRGRKSVQQRESGLRPLPLGNGDRPVEGVRDARTIAR